jgi:hypothetical protein
MFRIGAAPGLASIELRVTITGDGVNTPSLVHDFNYTFVVGSGLPVPVSPVELTEEWTAIDTAATSQAGKTVFAGAVGVPTVQPIGLPAEELQPDIN